MLDMSITDHGPIGNLHKDPTGHAALAPA